MDRGGHPVKYRKDPESNFVMGVRYGANACIIVHQARRSILSRSTGTHWTAFGTLKTLESS